MKQDEFIWRCYRLASTTVHAALAMVRCALSGTGPARKKKLDQLLGFYDEDLLQRLANRNPVWIHAVSTGEVVAASGIIERLLHLLHPDTPIVLSTTCWEAERLARKKVGHLVEDVFFHPLDSNKSLNRLFFSIKPRLLAITETDIWPMTVWKSNRYGCPVALINGRISLKTERFYLRVPALAQRVWESFSVLLVQSEAEAGRLRNCGAPPEKITIAGNAKFDVALAPLSKAKRNELEHLGLNAGRPTVICGSTHREDEDVLIKALSAFPAKHFTIPRLVLAPRDPGRAGRVAQRFTRVAGNLVIRSEVDERTKTGSAGGGLWDVMVLDTMGELGDFYQYGSVAFVGGSFGGWGGHSLIEPLAAGCLTIHGPDMRNFESIARDACRSGAAVSIASVDDFVKILVKLARDPEKMRKMGKDAGNYARQQAGSATRQAEALVSLLLDQK